MDGRAGAVALNVRQMLTPPRGSCVPESPAPDAEDEPTRILARYPPCWVSRLFGALDERTSKVHLVRIVGFAWDSGIGP